MTTLVRWEPFRELASFQNEMSRFMNGLFDGPGRVTQSWVPALDVWQSESEVPGIAEDAINIEVKDDTLTVSANREKTEEVSESGFYRYERRFGTFARAVGLPKGVDQDKIAANYEHGVLEVRVPKPEEAKPRTIALSKTIESNGTGE